MRAPGSAALLQVGRVRDLEEAASVRVDAVEVELLARKQGVALAPSPTWICQPPTVTPEEWDWTRTVVDHLDVHASRYSESVRFYEVVLAPLGIPKLFERHRESCFTRVNVVDQQPPP
jgi:hypothetical protein